MKWRMVIALTMIAGVMLFGQTTIGYTSFEEPSTGDQYVDTGDASTDHALGNNTGQADVNYVSTGGEMGFSAYYTNTRNDVGATEGDYIGVTDYTPDGNAFPDGSQAYQLQDADGKITVTLDELTVDASTTVYFSAKVFIEDTGYESEDAIRIWLTVDGSTEVDLINLSGDDIEAYENIGTWATLSEEVNPSSSVVLRFELDSNAGVEAFWIDDIVFTTGGAIPNAPVANAGGNQMVATGATVTLDGSGSSDPDNNIDTYQWTQFSGPTVSLSNANSATATFTAPSTDADLSFELLVTDETDLESRRYRSCKCKRTAGQQTDFQRIY
ncbi:MAG: PKD domain-containing protein [Candidatus Marinimicrobia bacterium]|nr:PKD domain-containing protein [Candidatus Neomarinimicrobiota bacterium]